MREDVVMTPSMTPFEEELFGLLSREILVDDDVPHGFHRESPLFDALGLDSTDALKIAVLIEARYGVALRPGETADGARFATLAGLAAHVEAARPREVRREAPAKPVSGGALRALVVGRLREAMVEMFDVEPAKVTEAARLFEDLGLDSIDALDMVGRLQEIVGCRIPESKLRDVRRVGDVVDVCVEMGVNAELMAAAQ